MKNQNIVCLSYTTWEGSYVKSTVELMKRLSQENRVLFIEYPFTILDIYRSIKGEKKRDTRRIVGLKGRLRRAGVKKGHEAYALTLPPTLPFAFISDASRMKNLLALNVRFILPAIKKALKKLGMYDDFILIDAFNPFYGLAIKNKLGEKTHIYYCYDALSESRYGETGQIIEDEYMQSIDGVIVSSDHLKKLKSNSNKNCFVVKNGVEFEKFHEYFKSHRKKRLKKIGYIGSIDFRFEAEMISWVAEQLKDYEFEFVGRVASRKVKAVLDKIPNARFHAPVKPDQVPAIMFNCDVGIIPYTRIEENKNVYPLKINEYLAVGTPVVMTDFAELEEFRGLVSVASTKQEFLDKLVFEIENDSPEKQSERVAFASKNSWDGRTVEFGNAVEKIIALKS